MESGTVSMLELSNSGLQARVKYILNQLEENNEENSEEELEPSE